MIPTYSIFIGYLINYTKNHKLDQGMDLAEIRTGFIDKETLIKVKFCQHGFFRCNYGLVIDSRNATNDFQRAHIPKYKRCDGKWDCSDGSDETYINEKCKFADKNSTECQLTIEDGMKFCGKAKLSNAVSVAIVY